ncbi:MAG: NAD(P)/FAD-dependent oxidoreductase, partial [Rhodoglobus sp.]|nr:NAD(P)/FAD-dependent oxidoreductase [Rhodoglobus sp.]
MSPLADAPLSAPRILDVVVVGAGVSGLYSVFRAKKRGWSVRAFEAGQSVGGALYWNRYPGCRVDIEGFEFSYSFSDELQQHWTWSERYPGQPEVERYLNHVCERFDLRPHISFGTRVEAVHFDETDRTWVVRTDRGESVRARTVILCTGIYSVANRPHFEGLDQFEGRKLYSSNWPKEPVDFAGQRVGLIGTGASGVQLTPILAQQAQH